MKITIDGETYDISDQFANEIRERARAESGEFRDGYAVRETARERLRRRFPTGTLAAQFGTDNDADLRLVMEVD